MRVLQLGVGSVGEVTARTVAAEPEVSTMVLADIDEERTKAVAKKLPAGKAETLQLDVTDSGALRRALADADFVINGLIPEYNMDLMNACLETNTNYLDMAAGGPRDIVGTADVDEQLARSSRRRASRRSSSSASTRARATCSRALSTISSTRWRA